MEYRKSVLLVCVGSLAFAITLLLLTVMGCGTAVSDDDGVATPTPSPPFSAQLKIVAPYSWMGNFYAFPYDGRPSDPDCEGVNECLVDLDNEDTLQVAITGDNFLCVNQFFTIGQTNNGQTVELTDAWKEEGQCGLAPPNGKYGTYDVVTKIDNLDGSSKVWIWIGSLSAIVSGDTFSYQNDEYLLEGSIYISKDLIEIYYHRVVSTGETEGTLTL